MARHSPQSSSHSASPVSFSCVCLAFRGPPSGKCLPQSPQESHLSFSRIWEQRPVSKKLLSLLANLSHVLTFAFLQEWSHHQTLPKTQLDLGESLTKTCSVGPGGRLLILHKTLQLFPRNLTLHFQHPFQTLQPLDRKVADHPTLVKPVIRHICQVLLGWDRILCWMQVTGAYNGKGTESKCDFLL